MPPTPATATQYTKEQLEGLISEIVGKALADVQKNLAANNDAARSDIKHLIEAVRPPTAIPPEEKGVRFARFVRCLRAAQLGAGKAEDIAKKLGDEVVAKALAETVFAQGGALVPQQFSDEVIDLLRPASVVRSSGPIEMPLVGGQATIPFVATGITAAYVGENQPAPRSEPTFGQLQFNAKELAAICPISNALLRDGGPKVDRVVRDDLVRAFAQREDAAFLLGTGMANTPRGFISWVPAANVLTETNLAGVVNGATALEIAGDLARVVRVLLDSDIPMGKPTWHFSPRVWSRLFNQMDANSQYIWQGEMKGGTLMGFPYKLTTQIPGNYATPIANSTRVFLVDYSSVVVADAEQLEVAAFDGATYWDGAAFQSGLSNNQTVIRGISRHDFGCRRRGAEIVQLNCSWGAV